MILPTKRLPLSRSLVGQGSHILQLLDRPKTVSRLWADYNVANSDLLERRVVTFDWFVLTLDFLHLVGAVALNRGLLRKVKS